SLLFRTRTHMGAQWANTLQYLYLLTNDKKYLKISRIYNEALKHNLTLEKDSLYVWNMTYDQYENKQILNGKKRKTKIQDVAHGNHVVNYIITSYQNGLGDWSREDIKRLKNTFLINIYKGDGKVSDYVDGSIDPMHHTGWK